MTEVYRTPTPTDQYLLCDSQLSLVHKLGDCRNLHYRTENVPTRVYGTVNTSRVHLKPVSIKTGLSSKLQK